MLKSLQARLALAAVPGLLVALFGGKVVSDLAPSLGYAIGAAVLLVGLALALLLQHVQLIRPLKKILKGVGEMRSAAGPLPKELPIHRADELGLLARQIALLGGERNVSELRRQESETKVAALTDAIADSIFRIDNDGVILGHQPPKEVPSFVEAGAILGRKLKDVFPESVNDQCVDALASVFVENEPQHFRFDLTVAGEARSYEARFARASQAEVLAIVRDTTRQKQTATSHERLNAILDATLDPVVTVTRKGEIQYMNPAGRSLLGIKRSTLSALLLENFLADWAQGQILRTAISTAIEDGSWQGESALVSTDGREIPMVLTAVPHQKEDGTVELLSFIGRDQSERKRFDDHVSFLADHDPLTSLHTRRRFVEELGREIARAQRSGAGGAVLLLDLDDFKYVNESLGHRTGDRLLTGLAQVLRKTVRESDVLARLDGDEFAILVAEMQPSRVDFVTERLLKAVRNHSVQVGEQPVGTTGSVGIAFFPEHGTSAEELLARADQALDQAKQRGRDQFVVYRPDKNWQASVDSRLSGEKLIRDALTRGRFVLYLQPILDVKTNKIVQYEVLLRMLGEGDELVPPMSFLPTAERFGLIRSLDRWVVRQSIQLLGRQKKLGHTIRLSVNLSGKSLGDLELTTIIEKELTEQGVEPGQLTLEVTETTAITDTERAKIFAVALKQIGCRLALDDFGAGFSSFNYLKHLPVDYLKIDGSFIRDLPKSAIDQHLVRAMVEVARALRKRTVAEFVGSEETLELIKSAGVDYGQGFFIGKPDAATTLLPSEPAETVTT